MREHVFIAALKQVLGQQIFETIQHLVMANGSRSSPPVVQGPVVSEHRRGSNVGVDSKSADTDANFIMAAHPVLRWIKGSHYHQLSSASNGAGRQTEQYDPPKSTSMPGLNESARRNVLFLFLS